MATATDHQRVDEAFSAFDLSADAGYSRFLSALAAAYLPVESALDDAAVDVWLPDWPDRRRAQALRDDLDQLGVAVPPAIGSLAYADKHAALGAIYVLEGSRHGAALLRRSVPAQAPQRFLEDREPAASWRWLVELLDTVLDAPPALDTAIASARHVFRLFEAAGCLYLERHAR